MTERFRTDNLITYPFPLRGNKVLARLDLPADLTTEEAERITAFIRTLPMDADP